MTLGVGLDESGSDLAALMGAVEDRAVAGAASHMMLASAPFETNRQLDPSDGVNSAGGSSYSEYLPLLPSTAGLTGVMGAGGDGDNRAAMDALCSNLAGFGGLFETIGKADTYMTRMLGKPWPTPLNQGKISAGYTFPTVSSKISNINKGWNAAAQPGDSPGAQYGYSDKTLGPSTWEEALTYAPSPLAEKVGELQGLGAVGVSDPGLKKVLKAAANPGTQDTGKVARELLAQSVKIGNLTGKRAQVMENARKHYTSLVRQVANIDSETQRLANKLFDAEGEPNPTVSVADIRKFRMLRKKGFKLGREAIRYQKTNVLATGLTKNGYAQAKLLQDMAMTMMTGRGKTTAVLAAQFEMIAGVSKDLKARRELQVARWGLKSAQEKVQGLEGLGSLRGPIERALGSDYWEADLAGAEFFEMEYLGALEGAWGWIKKTAKKAVKKVSKPIKKAVKKGVKTVSRAAKSGYQVSKAVARGKFKKAGKLAYRHASKSVGKLYRVARKQVNKSTRRVVRAAGRVRKFAKKTYGTAKSVSKPVWRATKSVARVAIAPVKMSYSVGRNVARGDFRGAANSIARSVKSTASNIASAAGSITFGLTCAVDRSPVGKAASQAVGQAVGTFFGGPAGGAVGHEAGRKANEASRGICSGMDRVGLTRGRVRPNQIGPAFKQTAVFLAKKTFSPKELLKSGVNIGMNYATGGTGAGAAASQAAQQAAREGVTTAVRQQIRSQAEAQIRSQIERGIQDRINQSPELRALSRSTPLIKAAYQGVGAFRGGEVNMDVLKNTLSRQGEAALKKYGPRVAGKAVGAVAGRRVGRFVSTAGRVSAMTPTQRRVFMQQQAMRGGRRFATRAVRRVSPQAAAVARRAQMVARMSPALRRRFLQQQVTRGGQRLASRAVRRVSPQAAAAARRAQMLARMSPTLRRRLLQQQQIMRGARRTRRLVNMSRRVPVMPTSGTVRGRAMAHARARQRMGVPGALLRA